jgi:hypothetical protein
MDLSGTVLNFYVFSPQSDQRVMHIERSTGMIWNDCQPFTDFRSARAPGYIDEIVLFTHLIDLSLRMLNNQGVSRS